ncbi:AAA domain-containing protein [Streptomyces sp. cf386]|uniref:AAA domain-containing protein n=1 Tax=Streptomyces sp. cf386 TaxID=1761904 RepID=UPI00088C5BE7|nr:AAA domain-containing protein [Streptomyces sp. cf386]SDO95472.1 AAA domain-containing protein [Streptomyces sp. cf386]
MALGEMDALVTALFCGTESTPYGSFRVPGGGSRAEGAELLPGTLYRYELADRATKAPVTVQFYLGVSGLGEGLWKQELTVLRRVAALQHPALPGLVHGGYIEESATRRFGIRGCAYVVTRSGQRQLYDETDPEYGMRPGLAEEIEDLRDNRREAVAQFMSLADALSVLHDMRIVHRNIWPGTISRAKIDGKDQMVLSRFEMSGLVSNLLRSFLLDARERAAHARRLIVSQGSDALVYFSPERLRFLLQEGARLEDFRSDTYSLGMVVAEWMTGPIPDHLLAEAEAAMTAGPEAAPDPDRLLAAAHRVNGHLADAVRVLPGPLATLLRDMIEWGKPTGRPSAMDVVGRLSDHYELVTVTTAEGSDAEHLLVFMPDECRKTLLQWELIDLDPTSEEGRLETTEFILSDLREARLLHLPDGALPFVPGADADKLRAADQLLMGRDIAWFCRLYEPDRAGRHRGTPDPRGLLLTFALQLDSARGRSLLATVKKAKKWRFIPPRVRIEASDIHPREMGAQLRGSPSWEPLLEAVQQIAPKTRAEREYAQAFEWLLQFQRIELEARRYPYVMVEEPDQRGSAVLRFDEERDRMWRFGSAMATAFANTPSLRPLMGDFFAGSSNEDGTVSVSVHADDKGRPARTPSFTGDCIDAHTDTVTLAVGRRSESIPEKGWLILADDFGSWMALDRQQHAAWELLENRVLVEQLAGPKAANPVSLNKRSTAERVVEALSDVEPLFALQGPPGTGKTEVTSRAIVRYLEREPGDRVLVSTQSNFALDNIAERLLRKLDLLSGDVPLAQANSDVIAVRASSIRREDKVDELVKPFLIHHLAERTQQEIISRTSEKLNDAHGDEREKELLATWREVVRDSLPELIDRLHRAANLVFATCSSATRDALAHAADTDLFNWVVIEEAAKAWPTELAIPLARGTRWSLVGDHRQLPAHRRREVLDFLDVCERSGDLDLQLHGKRKDSYLDVFGMFGHLFAHDPTPPVKDPPRHTLRTQYRMRPAISQIVSRLFYAVDPPDEDGHVDIDAEGLLATGRDDTPVLSLPSPEAVLWLDTSHISDCSEEPAWCNPGEVRIINSLLQSLKPRPVPGHDGYGDHPVAVLTPYRRQLELFNSWGEIRPHASTIHAFQGREANVVIVSLVRDQKRGPAEQPWRSIGHLNEPELVNVLFSRAREHLIVVGSFEHFRSHGGPMWEDVCALVQRYGVIVPAGEAGVI